MRETLLAVDDPRAPAGRPMLADVVRAGAVIGIIAGAAIVGLGRGIARRLGIVRPA